MIALLGHGQPGRKIGLDLLLQPEARRVDLRTPAQGGGIKAPVVQHRGDPRQVVQLQPKPDEPEEQPTTQPVVPADFRATQTQGCTVMIASAATPVKPVVRSASPGTRVR